MIGENEALISLWLLSALFAAALAQVKGYWGVLVFPYALILPPVALVHMLLKPWNKRLARGAAARLALQAHARDLKIRA